MEGNEYALSLALLITLTLTFICFILLMAIDWKRYLGGLVTWICLLIGFISTGWISTIAWLIAFILMIIPIGRRLSYLVFKATHPNAKLVNYRLYRMRKKYLKLRTIATPMQIAFLCNYELNQHIQAIKNSEEAIQYYKSLNIDIEKIEEIRHTLMESDTGRFVTYCVVRTPELLVKYIEMEKKGLSAREIGNEFFRGLEGVR